jgi:hypothetical protein
MLSEMLRHRTNTEHNRQVKLKWQKINNTGNCNPVRCNVTYSGATKPHEGNPP